MVNNRVEMSVYSIVISRHLLLLYKCTCHILTLVILFIVTTTINVVFSLSHHVAELNLIVVIKQTSERERERKGERRFCSSILFSLSLLLSSSLSFAYNKRKDEEGKKDEHKTANARRSHAL